MSDTDDRSSVQEVAAVTNAWRNLGFGLVVGTLVAVGIFYAYVLSPDHPPLYDPSFYVALAVVLGVSIAVLLGLILSLATLVRRANKSAH